MSLVRTPHPYELQGSREIETGDEFKAASPPVGSSGSGGDKKDHGDIEMAEHTANRKKSFSKVPQTEPVDVKDLSWSHIKMTIDKKTVLHDCWGEVHQGQICGVMGPSGAGKTSLLNVLAGRISSHKKTKVEGKVLVGGEPVNPVTFRAHIAYVMQEDYIMATATPREALTFSANLRLPSTWTKEEISKKVEALITSLGIEECSNRMIGNYLMGISGISGGERKRTCVGIELVTDPTLLFLDEPTTGLDSYSALNLIKLLKNISQHCAILMTIHQPSSQIFFLMDVIVFMKEGEIFYQSPVKEMSLFYEKLGYQCPENYNPSDFIMDIVQSKSVKELRSENLFLPIPEKFAEKEAKSVRFTRKDLVFHFHSPFLKQFSYVVAREVVNTYRDYHTIMFKFLLTFILNLLYGLVYYRIGATSNGNTQDFNSHFGGLMLVMMFALFGSAQSVILTFPYERPMAMREYTTGTYGIPAYFISKIALEIPIVFCQMLFGWILAYFLMALDGNFIFLVLCSWGLGMVSCSIAMGLGCLVPNAKAVTELLPLVFLPQIFFAGFFIRIDQIPIWLRWAEYLCGLKYALNLAVMTEFEKDGHKCTESPEAEANCKNLFEINQIHPEEYYIYIISLFLLAAGFRTIGGLVLQWRAKSF